MPRSALDNEEIRHSSWQDCATIMTLLAEAHRQSCRGQSIAPTVYELIGVTLDQTLELLGTHAPDVRPIFAVRADAIRRETVAQLALEERMLSERDTARLQLLHHVERYAFDLDNALAKLD